MNIIAYDLVIFKKQGNFNDDWDQIADENTDHDTYGHSHHQTILNSLQLTYMYNTGHYLKTLMIKRRRDNRM